MRDQLPTLFKPSVARPEACPCAERACPMGIVCACAPTNSAILLMCGRRAGRHRHLGSTCVCQPKNSSKTVVSHGHIWSSAGGDPSRCDNPAVTANSVMGHPSTSEPPPILSDRRHVVEDHDVLSGSVAQRVAEQHARGLFDAHDLVGPVHAVTLAIRRWASRRSGFCFSACSRLISPRSKLTGLQRRATTSRLSDSARTDRNDADVCRHSATYRLPSSPALSGRRGDQRHHEAVALSVSSFSNEVDRRRFPTDRCPRPEAHTQTIVEHEEWYAGSSE